MDRQVLADSWGGLGVETEIILTKQPNTAALTVVFRVRDAELRRLKPFSATVTTGLNHLGLSGLERLCSILYMDTKPGQLTNMSSFRVFESFNNSSPIKQAYQKITASLR